MTTGAACRVRRLGRVDYAVTLEQMRAFATNRAVHALDEIWLLEHPAIYTLGVRARGRSLATSNGIPSLQTDRGGDVTYHGPGQPIVYVLLDLARRGLSVHTLVQLLEQAVIDVLQELGLAAARRPGAPGVYVEGRKIASLGLRVRGGRSYHGLAFNAAMDLAPFSAIDPCGYPGLAVTQLAEWRPDTDPGDVGERLLRKVLLLLGYTAVSSASDEPTEPTRVHDVRP